MRFKKSTFWGAMGLTDIALNTNGMDSTRQKSFDLSLLGDGSGLPNLAKLHPPPLELRKPLTPRGHRELSQF